MRGNYVFILVLALSESSVFARPLLVPVEDKRLALSYNQKRDPALKDYFSGDKSKVT
jgi:hypothetical protein